MSNTTKNNINNNSLNHNSRLVLMEMLPVNEKHLYDDRFKKKQLSISIYLKKISKVTMRKVQMNLKS